MLYIRNWDKFNLDKSSISLLSYYANQLSGLNYELKTNVRNQLLGILDIVDGLQLRTADARERVREGIETTRDILGEYGYQADNALEQAEELINRADEDLTDIRDEVETKIEEIDCSQGCWYDPNIDCNNIIFGCAEGVYDCAEGGDCGEGSNSCDHSSGCAGGYEAPSDCYQDLPTCGYTDLFCDQYCNVGRTDDCVIDKDCNESCGLQCDNIGTTGCLVTVEGEGGNTWETNRLCDEIACTHSGDTAKECGQVPDNCTFNCTYYSDCVEAPVPQNCNHTCADNGCNFTGQCTYQSISVDDYQCEENCCIWTPTEACAESSTCDGGDDYDQSCDELSCNETCTYGCSHSCPYSACGDCSDCSDSSSCNDVGCDGGDDYDQSCDELSCEETCSYGCSHSCPYSDCSDCGDGGEGGDDGGNVICTYIIHRLFNDDPYYLKCSEENVRIGLRHGGLPAKAFKEYYDGLGLDIIERLKEEDDSWLRELWDNKIFKVWMTLRTDAKEGVKMYAELVKGIADIYNIDYYKYKYITMYFKLMSLA